MESNYGEQESRNGEQQEFKEKDKWKKKCRGKGLGRQKCRLTACAACVGIDWLLAAGVDARNI